MRRVVSAILASSVLLWGAGVIQAQENTSGTGTGSTEQQPPAKKKHHSKTKHAKKQTLDAQGQSGSNEAK